MSDPATYVSVMSIIDRIVENTYKAHKLIVRYNVLNDAHSVAQNPENGNLFVEANRPVSSS
jgi:hypothetical protein